MNTVGNRVALVAILTTLGACASGETLRTERWQMTGGDDVEVRVENNNWMDMTVYALRQGAMMRLGTVTSMSTRTMKLPAGWARSMAEVRLRADPIGSRETYTTDVHRVAPGETMELRLQEHLAVSSLSIWSGERER